VLEPTVLIDPDPEARISSEEVFGPVVAIYRYSKLDDAIARANSLPVAFQASIFAGDIDVAMRAANRLDASAVMVNDPTTFRTDWMPFAGRRVSGYGTGGIPQHDARHDAGEDDPAQAPLSTALDRGGPMRHGRRVGA
jgi:acyl-CoA reductase-like NAD-dependent aldehyde dehydrogenase